MKGVRSSFPAKMLRKSAVAQGCIDSSLHDGDCAGFGAQDMHAYGRGIGESWSLSMEFVQECGDVGSRRNSCALYFPTCSCGRYSGTGAN